MTHFFLKTLACVATATFLSSCALVNVKLTRTNRLEAERTVDFMASTSHPATLLQQAEKRSLPETRRIDILLEAVRETSKARSGTEFQKLNQIATTRLVEILATDNFQSSQIRIAPDSTNTLDPRQASKLIASSAIQITGLRERVTVDGAGVPYVAWFAKGSSALAGQPNSQRMGMSIPATALVRFDENGPQLVFYRRLTMESVFLSGRKESLAADFSAPIAYLLSQGKNRSIDIQALFFSDKNFKHAGLLQIEEYDPAKIPVVFVHGLLSRPEAWTQAVNQLLADPEIRARYQFWFYLYPTGLPVWWSAANLRSELDRFRTAVDPAHTNPNLNKMVIVGHSMGGLISSLMVRKGGEYLWKQFMVTPPEQLKISRPAKEHLLSIVNFEPREDISRVIFVATPHQGSQIALNPFVDFVSNLVRLPNIFPSRDRFIMLHSIRNNMRDLFVAPANSIRFLRARSPLLLSILNLPMSKSVSYHSVIGDRGKGDTPDSSDGVVPYWSSHMPSAKSEKIVPSGHGANEDPAGIEEIRRILSLHLKSAAAS